MNTVGTAAKVYTKGLGAPKMKAKMPKVTAPKMPPMKAAPPMPKSAPKVPANIKGLQNFGFTPRKGKKPAF